MYVGTGKRGVRRRLAGAHRLSGLRGLRGQWIKGKYYSSGRLSNVVSSRLGQLTYDSSGNAYDLNGNLIYNASTGTVASSWNLPGSTPISSTSSGLTTAQEAQLLSQGISTAGILGAKALTPVPTVTYNPYTGAYSATGGAALPTSSIASSLTSSEISSYLPLLLLLGAGAVLLMNR